jgi:hypothetical protein
MSAPLLVASVVAVVLRCASAGGAQAVFVTGNPHMVRVYATRSDSSTACFECLEQMIVTQCNTVATEPTHMQPRVPQSHSSSAPAVN